MDLTKVTSEALDDFKKNTGILLPITKFILSNTLLLGLLIAVPFNIMFWVYQIAYLSTFGINYELILRGSFEAQGLWGEMYTSFSSLVISLFWVMIGFFFIFIILGFCKSLQLLYKKLTIFRPCKKKDIKVKSHRSKRLRKLKIWVTLLDKSPLKIFKLAYMTYVSSVVFLLLLATFTFFSLYVHGKGKEQSEKRVFDFIKHNTCNDGWGQTGCYSVIKGKEKFEGYLVAMNDLNIYFMTNKELLVIPRDKDVIIKRKLTIAKEM